MAIGCNTLALLEGREDSSYFAGCITSCVSLHEAAEDGTECTGLGCCQTPIPANLNMISVDWNHGSKTENPAWKYSPCSYAFVAEKGWYHFKRSDLTRVANKSFIDRVGDRTIPAVLDWAIRSHGSCCFQPEDGRGQRVSKGGSFHLCQRPQLLYQCHARSGYLCKCSEGYMGSPYVTGGCTNIDECELRKSNPARYEKLYPCYSGSTSMTHRVITRANADLGAEKMVKVPKGVSSYSQNMQSQ